MNGKELIRRVVEHREPPRHGFCFSFPYMSDFDSYELPQFGFTGSFHQFNLY